MNASGFDHDHLVFTATTGDFKWAVRNGMRKMLIRSGMTETAADAALRAVETGAPTHVPLAVEKDPVKQLRDLERVGILAQVCSCDGRGLDAGGHVDLVAIRRQLTGEERQQALRVLLEAAQTSPAACEILIDDALSREDLVQADHWQTRRQQLLRPPAAETQATRKASGAATWIGMSTPMDGGDF